MKSILIIEDDPDIVELLRYNLERESYRVTAAGDGAAGLDALRREPPDLLILDLMLPEVSGLDVCRTVRGDPELATLPVIMLTAKSEDADVISGIELGADDYITKPFSPRQLVARVGAVLRRVARKDPGTETATEGPLEIGGLTIDPAAHRVQRDGEELTVTHLEFRLLHHLAANAGRVFSRQQLLDRVWGRGRLVIARSVDVYIRRLRQKVDRKGQPSLLQTVRGAGYRFEARAD